jgi:hypothetical protein
VLVGERPPDAASRARRVCKRLGKVVSTARPAASDTRPPPPRADCTGAPRALAQTRPPQRSVVRDDNHHCGTATQAAAKTPPPRRGDAARLRLRPCRTRTRRPRPFRRPPNSRPHGDRNVANGAPPPRDQNGSARPGEEQAPPGGQGSDRARSTTSLLIRTFLVTTHDWGRSSIVTHLDENLVALGCGAGLDVDGARRRPGPQGCGGRHARSRRPRRRHGDPLRLPG